MKKIAVLGLVAGLTLVTGCDWGKKPQSANATPIDPPVPTNTPYVPPTPTPVVTTGTMDPVTPMAPVEKSKPVATRKPAPAAPSKSTASSTATKAGTTYTVKKGDSLSTIAQKVYGHGTKTYIDKIKKANNLKSDVITIGQKLKLPA